MPTIHIEIAQESAFTRFACTGKASLEGFREIVECIRATMAEPSRGHKVFVDVTGVEGELPEFEKFTLGEFIASRLGGLRIAALLNPRTPITRFGENTAVNRGATLLVGYVVEELFEWLALPIPADSGHFSAP